MFPRASCQYSTCTSCFDWFMRLSVLSVIGQSDNFGLILRHAIETPRVVSSVALFALVSTLTISSLPQGRHKKSVKQISRRNSTLGIDIFRIDIFTPATHAVSRSPHLLDGVKYSHIKFLGVVLYLLLLPCTGWLKLTPFQFRPPPPPTLKNL